MTQQSIHERFSGTGCMVICRDVPDSGALRKAAMADHLAYIATVVDQLKLAGPLYDEAGLEPLGSFYCLATRDPGEARALVENDPLFKAGVFAGFTVHATMLAAGSLVGGKAW